MECRIAPLNPGKFIKMFKSNSVINPCFNLIRKERLWNKVEMKKVEFGKLRCG